MSTECTNCGVVLPRMVAGLCWHCYMNKWYHANRDSVNARRRVKNQVLRAEMIATYGGACECCGNADSDVLTLYRVNGSCYRGKFSGLSGVPLYLKLRKMGWPRNGYRLLCLNCCMSNRLYGYCPHITGTRELPIGGDLPTRKKRYRMCLKLNMIREYGGKCAVCGESRYEFLTIDHVNGGGSKHRAEVNAVGGGDAFYRVLRDADWPKGDYRLLCFNCNGVMGNRKLVVV